MKHCFVWSSRFILKFAGCFFKGSQAAGSGISQQRPDGPRLCSRLPSLRSLTDLPNLSAKLADVRDEMKGNYGNLQKLWKHKKRCVPFIGLCFFFGCDLVIGMRSLWIHIIYCSILCIWYVFVNVFGYMISEIKDPFVIPYFRRPSTHAFPCPKQGFQQKFCSGCGIPSKLFSLMMTSLASTSKGYIEY